MKSRKALLAAALSASSLMAQATFVYINNNGMPNSISAYSVNPNGTLTPVPGAPFATGGRGGLCYDIGSVAIVGNFLYATNTDYRNGATVSGFTIAANGSLTPLPGSPFAMSPGQLSAAGLAASSDGAFLYVGRYYPYGGVDAFAINAGGSLTLVPGSPFGLGNISGFDVLFDGVRKNVISDLNNDKVSVFSGGGTGALLPIPGSPFTTPATGNNHKMALRPQGDCLYVAAGGVSVMQIAANGALANAPGSPVSIEAGGVLGAAVTPNGSFAYFGGVRGITGFSTGVGCALTPIAGAPVPDGYIVLAGLTTDGAGKHLFAVDSIGFSVTSFEIGPTGILTPAPGGTVPLQGGAAYCPVGIAATQCIAPVLTGASATPNVLWPPNHQFVDVTINYTETSPCPATCSLSVTSNEPPVNAKTPEWIIVDAHHVQLAAERLGNGNGRVYTITITCTTAAGSTSKSVTVTAPHDQRMEP